MGDKSTEIRIIGVVCIVVGIFFVFCGAMLFDNGLLALGNMLCLGGMMACLGMSRLMTIFTSASSLLGAAVFSGGIIVMLSGWARFGLILEVGGLFVLVGRYIGDALSWIKAMASLSAWTPKWS